jgi:thioredoxin-related protein
MANRSKFLLIIFLFILCSAKVNPTVHDKLDWMKMDDLTEKMKSNPKPAIIDIYTNWCYWCKVMDKKTYNNTKVVSYINDHFYPVKLNAETREIVEWKNKKFNFNENYKINDFAVYVSSGEIGFPTTVIIPDENADPISFRGFLEPKEIEPILKYFGEGAYKTQTYTVYKSTFKASW